MLSFLHACIDKLQATFPPNRIVVLLTPLVFVPAAGAVSAWVAEHFPGISLSEEAVIGFAVAGALSALTAAYKWLDGWQQHERMKADPEMDTLSLH